MPACNTPEQNALVNRARQMLSTYEDMAELIRLGAYKRGTDPKIDEAIQFNPALEAFLAQDIEESTAFEACYQRLSEIFGPAKPLPPPSSGISP